MGGDYDCPDFCFRFFLVLEVDDWLFVCGVYYVQSWIYLLLVVRGTIR